MQGQDSPELAIVRTFCGFKWNAPDGHEFLFRGSAGWANELVQNIAAELDDDVFSTEVNLPSLAKVCEGHLIRPLEQMHNFGHGIMTHAIHVFCIFHYIGRMVHAFEHIAFAGESGESVNQFHRLLHLNPCNDGGNCRRGWNFAFRCGFQGQQIARHSLFEERPIDLSQRTFVAWWNAWKKYAHNAIDTFDRSIYPWPVYFPRRTIDPEARFAIVQSRNNKVTPLKYTQAKIMNNIEVQRLDICIRR